MRRLIVSHSLFSLFAHPVRYVLGLSLLTLLLGVFFVSWAVVANVLELVSAYLALFGVSLLILALGLFMMAVVMQQGWLIQRELWMVQRLLARDQSLRRTLEMESDSIGAHTNVER